MMEWLEGHRISGTELVFDGAWRWEKGEKVLLMNQTGHILLIDQDISRCISEGKIDSELGFKMIQRGFAYLEDMSPERYDDEFDVKPLYFMIDFTNRCNMACRYCLRECDREKSTEKIINYEMLEKIADKIAEYCRKYEIMHISVQPWGGEPLMEKEKIFFFYDALKNRGVEAEFNIESNGIFLTPDVIKELSERQIFVSVSMDGDREIHDYQRVLLSGKPSHELVEEAVKNLKKSEGEDTPVLATITRESARNIEAVLEYFAVDLGVKRVKLNFVHKSSFVDNDNLCLTSEEIKDCTIRILDKVFQLMERGYEIYDYNICTKLNNLLLNRKTDVCLCRGCNGGKKMLTIDCDGNIFPCDISDYPEEKIGNIAESRDFVEMVQDAMETTSYFRKKHGDECDSCPWHFYCRGGCTVHVKCAGRPSDSIDDIECSVNKVLYPALIKKIMEEPAMVNKLMEKDILETE